MNEMREAKTDIQKKETTKMIYVVVTYGFNDDLANFLKSLKSTSIPYKVIVVNSFYDKDSEENLRNVAKSNDCVFIPSENKGYGHGMNVGITYAREHYDFEYLTITNADIVVEKMTLPQLDASDEYLIAPEIITQTGKRQNPFYIHSHKKLFLFADWMRSHHLTIFGYSVIVKAKIEREVFNRLGGKKKHFKTSIFAGHGAFIVFTRKALEKIGLPFRKDIFLYCEENFLGYKAMQLNIPYYYSDCIRVIHMEDGSTPFYKHNTNEETRKSGEKWIALLRGEIE